MDKTELIRLARLGAQARLQALRNEIAQILRQFPDLKARGDATKGPDVTGSSVRRRRRMSAAARKKVSLAQKKRWAEWRKKKGKA